MAAKKRPNKAQAVRKRDPRSASVDAGAGLLTQKEARFCEEYIVDLNGTQAYMRAFGTKNARSAAVQAARLLVRPNIVARVRALREEQAARTKRTADDVLEELWRVARLDIGGAFDEAGAVKRLADMPEDVRRAIAGIEVAELFGGVGDERSAIGLLKKIRLLDKIRALDLLGQHYGLWKSKVEVTGKNGGPLETRGGIYALSDDELAAIAAAGRDGTAASTPGER